MLLLNYRQYHIYPGLRVSWSGTVVAVLRESCKVKERKVERLKRERKMCKCYGPWASCRSVNLIFNTLIAFDKVGRELNFVA